MVLFSRSISLSFESAAEIRVYVGMQVLFIMCNKVCKIRLATNVCGMHNVYDLRAACEQFGI